MSKQTDREENIRRQFAVALGSITFECQVKSVEVIYRDYEISLVFNPTKSGWYGYHDHDPDDSGGHVTVGEDDSDPEKAIVACYAAALAYDRANPE